MGVLDGLFGAIGNVASSVLAYNSQQQTNKSNQQMMREQMAWEEQMWNKNNEYNTPEQQVERMKAAGLNPVSTQMANGTSIDGAGNSSSPPSSYQMIPNQDPMQSAGNFARSFADASSLMQDAILKRDTRKIKVAEAERSVELLEKSIEGMDIDNATKDIALSFAAAERQAAIDESKSRTNVNNRQAKYLDKQYDELCVTLEKVIPQQIRESMSRTAANESQVKLNYGNFKLVTQEFENAIKEAEEIESRTKRNNAEADLLAAEQDETKQRAALERQEKVESIGRQEINRLTAAQLRSEYSFYCKTYNDRANQVANESKKSNRDVKSYWIRLALNGGDTAAKGAAAGAVVKKAAAAAPK